MMRLEERRVRRRYPMSAMLEYRLLKEGLTIASGSGWLANISSGGVLFTSNYGLPPGSEVELTIWWPVKLDGYIPLTLRASGTTVRAKGMFTAVKLNRYEFHIRAKARVAVAEMAMTA